MNTEWPTAKICQDLQLSPPLIHFVQQALALVPHSSPLTTSQQLLDLQQCILELEASSLNYRRHTTYTNYNTLTKGAGQGHDGYSLNYRYRLNR